ncbi:hypothetical protein [Pseudobutyrivibrio sp.]
MIAELYVIKVVISYEQSDPPFLVNGGDEYPTKESIADAIELAISDGHQPRWATVEKRYYLV